MMTRLLFSLLIVVLLLTGCRQQSPMPQENSIYYWRTEWRLDSLERDFLKQYDIHKVYCRYFDVVMRNNEPMPNATISFTEPIAPSLSIVPTVYITENCMHSEHKGLAERIVERIVQMNETNDVKNVKEIQIVLRVLRGSVHDSPSTRYAPVNHHPSAPTVNGGTSC